MAAQLSSLMAKGSKWKVTEDLTIENLEGSRYEWSKNTHGHPLKQVQTKRVDVDLKQGDILTIADKAQRYHPMTYDTTGLLYPVYVNDRKGHILISYKEFSKNVELHQAVEQLTLVLYSPTHGYISNIPMSWHEEGNELKSSTTIEWSEKLSKAIKKKRMSDAKQFLLSNSGYYAEMNAYGSGNYDYVLDRANVQFPDDLEIRTYDKISKVLKATESAKTYLDDMNRLRPITLRFGSPARALFKEIENNADEYQSLLMFKVPKEDYDPYSDDSAVKKIKDQFKEQNFARGSYKMKSDHAAICFAFKRKADAVMFKLAVTSDMQNVLLDAKTLAELTS